MMKNEKGVTLIILVVVIVILAILAVISVEFGSETIKEVENNQIETELSTVQQAIFQQYTLLESYNEDGKIPQSTTENVPMRNDKNRSEYLIGIRIADSDTLVNYGFTTYQKKYTDNMSFEEYYYILDINDLNAIGIFEENQGNKDEEYVYIVNYSTGEVFDLKYKIYINEYDSTLDDAILKGTGNTLKVEENKYDFTE